MSCRHLVIEVTLHLHVEVSLHLQQLTRENNMVGWGLPIESFMCLWKASGPLGFLLCLDVYSGTIPWYSNLFYEFGACDNYFCGAFCIKLFGVFVINELELS